MSAPRSSTIVAAVSRSKAALRRACKPVFEGLESRQMLAVDPVMAYTFNEGGGTAVNDTGTGDAVNNSGTLVASAAGTAPQFLADTPSPAGGSYLRFSGSRFAADGTTIDTSLNEGGRVDLANSLAPVLGSTSSLAYWLRLGEGVRGQGSPWDNPAVTGSEQAAGGNDIFLGNVNGSGSVLAKAGDGAEATSRPVNDGSWHHVVHTYNHTSGQLRTYVDGSLHSSVTSQTGPKTQAFSSLGALVLRSNDLATVVGYNYLNGDLDQVEVYDRALTPQEVATRYGAASTTPPAAPTGLVANTDRVRAVTLTFNDVAGALGYRVLRSTTGAAGPFTEVAVLGANTGTPTETFTQTNLTAGQPYHYQVVAFNAAGESAAPASIAATPAATGQGVVGHYYNSNFWGNTARPADTNSIVIGNPDVREAIGNSVNFNWPDGGAQGTNSPHPSIRVNDFSTAYAGKLVAPESGLYTVLGYGDDDTHVFVNGILVSSDPLGHGVPGNDEAGYNAIDTKTSIELVAGQKYDVLVLQAEGGGGAGVILRWVTPSRQSPTGAYVQPATVPVTALETGSLPLTAPTNLSVSGGNGWHQVDITFQERNTGEVRYVLERSLNGGPFQLIRTSPLVPNSWDGTAGGFTAGSGFMQDLVSVPGTYTYRLRAENFEGAGPAATATLVVNESSPPLVPNPDPTVPAGTGAQGYYFNTEFWGSTTRPADYQISINGVPNYTENAGDVVENYGDNAPNGVTADPGNTNAADTFSTVFTGTITPPTTGQYEILAFSDDDSYVWVNGQLVSADPGGHGIPGNDAGGINSIDTRNAITLTGGQAYNFVAVQAEGGGGAGIILRWKLPGTSNFVDIPASAFTSNIPKAVGAQPNGAPLAPTNVRVDDADRQASYVILRWNDNATNELRHTIERTNVATGEVARFNAPINATSYLDATTAPNTQYTYRVLAGNFVDAAAGSVTVTTLAANTPPAAPTNVIATARNTPSVSFRDASLNETQFIIERATVTGGVVGGFAEVARVNGSANGVQGGYFRFSDNTAGVTPGATYEYRVVAVNPGGNSAPSAASRVAFTPRGGTGVAGTYYNRIDFTNEGGAPLVISPADLDENFGDNGPAGLTADSTDPDAPDTFSSLLQGYIIPEFSERYTFRMSSDDGLALQLVDPDTGNVLIDYNNLGRTGGVAAGFEFNAGSADLVSGKRYALIVRQVEHQGGAGYRVGWESPSLPLETIPVDVLFPATATEPLVPGSITSVQPVGTEQVNLTFNPNLANLNETGYQVLRSTTGAPGSFGVIGTVGPDATSFVDNQGIQAGQTYYYQIRPVRNAELGPVSPVASTTAAAGGTGVTLGGTATVLPGGVLQLTDNVNDRRGTAFTSNARQVVTPGQGPAGSAGFQTTFNFTVPEGSLTAEGAPNMADGFAFVIQRNSPTAIGNGGGGLGYTGMPNSLAIEFDIYNGQNEVGVYYNGTNFVDDDADGNSVDTGLVFGNGHEYRVDIKYNADTDTIDLTITDLTDTAVAPFTTTFSSARTGDANATPPAATDSPLDIPALIGGNQAFFGFTGATGGLNADQRISDWTLNGESIPFVPPVTRKPGDADGDGDVDGVDIARWSLNFTGSLNPGEGGKTVDQGDFDGDADVDGNDAAIWSLNFTGELGGGGLAGSAPAAAAAPTEAAPVARPAAEPVAQPVFPASPAVAPVTPPATTPVATPVTAPVATPVAAPVAKPVTKPVTTPAKPTVTPVASKPVTTPAAKPVVTKPAAKPLVKPAAKPVAKPAVKPATTARTATAPKAPALSSIFSSRKIGAVKPSVLGSTGGVLK